MRWLLIAGLLLLMSCSRQARVDAMMTWAVPPGEKTVVLRFVEDPHQGIIEDWSPDLQARLTRAGNPVRMTFDCWRQIGGTFGFNPVAINGEPFHPTGSNGPSRAGAFAEGDGRRNPLESHLP